MLPDNITEISQGLFYQCDLLNSVSLPGSLTEIKLNAFFGCKNLSAISLPETVATIGSNAFKDCWNLSEFEFGPAVDEHFSQSALTSLGTSVFSNCYSLASIKLPINLVSIGNSTFKMFSNYPEGYEPKLSELRLPDTVTSIGSFAFSGCSNLEECLLGASLQSIGSSTFENCTSLKHLVMPESVSTIYPNAFKGCSGLRYLEFLGDNPGEFSGSLSAFSSSSNDLLPLIFIDPDANGWADKWSGKYTKSKSAISLIAQIRKNETAPENSIIEVYSYDSPTTVTLSASPPVGYLFEHWIDDKNVIISYESPLVIQLGSAQASTSSPEVFAISAESSQDDADNDSDLLSNYQEVAIYFTDANDSDSNDDNVSDGNAVSFWNSVFDYIKDNRVSTSHQDKVKFTREMLDKSIDGSGIAEMRMEDLIFNKKLNGNFDVTLTLECSEDLDNWQDLAEITFEVVPEGDKRFYQVIAD